MATTLKDGAEILNETLRNIGYDFQIDTTSSTTITEGLEKIGAFPPEQLNVILNQMNLVIQNRNYAAMFTADDNKFRDFIVDMIESGFGIEDIFHELIEGAKPQWDKTATGAQKADRMFSYDNNKIHKTFHVEADSNQVKTTIDTRNYKKVFTPYGVTSFIDVKLANLSYSMEVWLMDKIIDTIKEMISDGKCVFSNGMDLNSHQGVANACEKIRATASGFTTVNALYNFGVWDEDNSEFRAVRTITKRPEDIYIVTTPENFERLKVQGYANAFNLSEFELKNRIIYVPAGTSLGTVTVDGVDEEVLFLVMDRRTIVVGIKFWQGSSTGIIPTSFETNNFLTAEIMKSYNTFFNCVAFTGAAVEPIKKNDNGNITTFVYKAPSDGVLGTDFDISINGVATTADDYTSFTGVYGTYYTYKNPIYGANTIEVEGKDTQYHIDSLTIQVDGTKIGDIDIGVKKFSVEVPAGSSCVFEIAIL